MELTDRTVALAGNPNVGKSTLFNGLTGMHQHTGNWSGKTVSNARGRCSTDGNSYLLVDIPGTYSLLAHSAEEEVARDYVCFGSPDAVAVVCDGSCLERNLNLVLQIMEVCPRTAVCVNLLDEAKRKGINVDLDRLSELLGVPVVGTVARKKKTLSAFTDALDGLFKNDTGRGIRVEYPPEIENELEVLTPLTERNRAGIDGRWLALRLLENDRMLKKRIEEHCPDTVNDPEVIAALSNARRRLLDCGITPDRLHDMTVTALMDKAQQIAGQSVTVRQSGYGSADRRADKILTGRLTAFPFMILLLTLVFWLTVSGANYPSEWLSRMLFALQDKLNDLFIYLGAPDWLRGVVVMGAYRVLAWVVSVMLPPMAIFFPLFTLLEDLGYLPRVAYNLDRPFHACGACGKQALTMCMGFGCNAAGVVGCRIIDSPRERLLAIITNSLVPCNGKFPTMIALVTAFFVSASCFANLLPSLAMTLLIIIGVGATMLATRFLSRTLLKGVPSSFALELPSYRTPQVGRVIVRSLLDRTVYVLGRAVIVAAPAGALIWVMANVTADGQSLLAICSGALDPFARLMGLDGVILMAFILGIPANETVMPIILMAYASQSTLPDLCGTEQLRTLLTANGWTPLTAVCTVIFSLMHWPCTTTLISVYKETHSLKWTFVSAALPTVMGMICCMVITAFAKLMINL